MNLGYLDLLPDAVGRIRSDGTLRAENRAMRELCEQMDLLPRGGGGAAEVKFLDLPFAHDDRLAFRSFFESPTERHEFVVRMAASPSTR